MTNSGPQQPVGEIRPNLKVSFQIERSVGKIQGELRFLLAFLGFDESVSSSLATHLARLATGEENCCKIRLEPVGLVGKRATSYQRVLDCGCEEKPCILHEGKTVEHLHLASTANGLTFDVIPLSEGLGKKSLTVNLSSIPMTSLVRFDLETRGGTDPEIQTLFEALLTRNDILECQLAKSTHLVASIILVPIS